MPKKKINSEKDHYCVCVFFKKYLFILMKWECAFHGQHVKVKGQLGGVHSVLQF